MKVEHKQFGNNPLQFSPFCFQLKIPGEIPGSYHAFLELISIRDLLIID